MDIAATNMAPETGFAAVGKGVPSGIAALGSTGSPMTHAAWRRRREEVWVSASIMTPVHHHQGEGKKCTSWEADGRVTSMVTFRPLFVLLFCYVSSLKLFP